MGERALTSIGLSKTRGEKAMKYGFRKPSLRKSLAARTSLKRVVRHSLGVKAPRGAGWLTNPKKAAYNRVYSRSTVSIWALLSRLFK